ncbi:syntaxin-17 [Euwallacea similis]|uniref:syntaxin-17 n=1 Tax=Euwallacea similis TaxID=1736056 RepID=UPI00344C6E13
MASIPNANIIKQPLKYLEIPLNKFSDEVIPHHQKVLEQHKVYVHKLIAVNDTKQLEKEIKDKKRSIKQLRDLLYELDTLRTQVEDDGLDAFDTKTMPLRSSILRLTRTYQELENRVDKMTPKNEPSPMSSPDERINPFEGAQAIQLQEDLDSLRLQQEQARLNGVQELQKKSEDLLEIHKDLHKLVKAQGEQVEEVEINVTAAQDNIQAGFLDVVKVNKLKVVTYPATGAFVGSLIGGPIGFLAGIKVGGLAALGCAVAGYMGGKLLKRQKDLDINDADHVINNENNENHTAVVEKVEKKEN